jgi:PAT family beta-lactamase induction signal transducer AmpG
MDERESASVVKMKYHRVHPWVFMVLIIPFGVVAGYFAVTVAYELKQAGVAVGPIAALSALVILPQTWKFFWAPVVDLTLDQKKWYLLSGILTAIGIGMIGFFPVTKAGLVALSVIAFVSSVATTVLGMAVESLMAHGAPEDLKGRSAGWYQAGNLGGAGIGGGLGLVLVEKLPAPWMPDRFYHARGVLPALRATLADLWQMVRKRAALLALILCFLPIGTGAAPFAAIADEWRTSANTVAAVTGVLGGVISAVGCLVGGWFCDRMNRQAAYVWFGIIQAATGIIMALLPRTPVMYVTWALVYSFTMGLTYAAFSAFALEAIGKGAAATKYNALACLSNIPIYYMTNMDGWAHDRWNSTGMFFTESALALAAAVIFFILARILLK